MILITELLLLISDYLSVEKMSCTKMNSIPEIAMIEGGSDGK